jgi:hypothetical protein
MMPDEIIEEEMNFVEVGDVGCLIPDNDDAHCDSKLAEEFDADE